MNTNEAKKGETVLSYHLTRNVTFRTYICTPCIHVCMLKRYDERRWETESRVLLHLHMTNMCVCEYIWTGPKEHHASKLPFLFPSFNFGSTRRLSPTLFEHLHIYNNDNPSWVWRKKITTSQRQYTREGLIQRKEWNSCSLISLSLQFWSIFSDAIETLARTYIYVGKGIIGMAGWRRERGETVGPRLDSRRWLPLPWYSGPPSRAMIRESVLSCATRSKPSRERESKL